MKSLLVLLAIALLGVDACGGTGKGTGSTPPVSSSATATAAAATASTAATQGYTKTDSDRDNDIGAPYDDRNNSSVLDFARAASAADERAITALVKRYYATAAAGDGAKACSLLYSTLAEAVPEDYGQPPGPPYLRGGKTCPAVMVLLFKHFHDQLTVELPKLKVTRVRLREHHGLAVLNFGSLPERQIQVAREGHRWKIDALLDSELP